MAAGFSTIAGGGPTASPVVAGGGGYASPIAYRSPLDLARSVARLPEAEYPDGYLNSGPVRYRSDQQGYDRGPAAVTKLRPEAYLWPDDFNLGSALEQQEAGLKFVSIPMERAADLVPTARPDWAGSTAGSTAGLTEGGNHNYPGYAGPAVPDPAMLDAMRPPWTI